MPLTKKSPKTANLQASSGAWRPCLLTWYDPALGGTNSSHGQKDPHAATASGEPYSTTEATCAAPPEYPFGTLLTFRFAQNQVTCRVTDRGGAIKGHHFDLNKVAADSLAMTGAGTVNATFAVSGSAGSTKNAPANNTPPAGSQGGGFQIGSILDLLTAPIDAIGGWLASIALTVVKDVGEGAVAYIIRPAWHWNQRAAMQYQTDMFGDKSGKQILWTAAFWGGGYWLLFTDPNSGNLKPAPVRGSRLARHARFGQSLPARHTLVKPKDVIGKTAKKPEPVESRATVTRTGTMSTTRHQTVRVTGTHARFNDGNGTESTERIERADTPPPAHGNATRNKPTVPPAVPNEKHGARTRSPSDSGRNSKGTTGKSDRGGGVT